MALEKLVGSILCADKKWRSNPLLDSKYVTVNVYRSEKGTTVLEFEHNKAQVELNKHRTEEQAMAYAASSLQKKYRLHVISKNLK